MVSLSEKIALKVINAASTVGNIKNVFKRQLSIQKESWINQMFETTYNPDEKSPIDYKKMIDSDSQVKTALDLITLTLLSKKYIITPASEDSEDIEIAEFIENTFKSMSIPMRRVRKDLYTALPYGYAVSELVYTYDDINGHIKIDKIKSIDIETLDDCFKYDRYGNVSEVVQTLEMSADVKIPVEKCLIYSFDEESGNKYGTSILKQIYDNYYMKERTLRWWMIFLQKLQSPFLHGKTSNPAWRNAMQSILDEVKEGRTNLVTGIEDDIKILESSQKGEGFLSAITYHNVMIFRRMMIGSLILGQADASGSYAQSQTQMDIFKLFLDGIHEDIASIFQEKIKFIIDINFKTGSYPAFSFEPFTEKDVLGLMNMLQPYVQSFAISPEAVWFKQLIAYVVEHFSDVKVEYTNEEERAERQELMEEDITPEKIKETKEQTEEMTKKIKQALAPTTETARR